jgi:poly(3-hydroxybutyrate) depolymerase
VFFFHGTGGTGERYWNISRWKELADRHGFIAVFPSALGYDLNTDRDSRPTNVWNTIGQACDLVDPSLIADDVGFVRQIHRDLAARLPVNSRRIYAAGFSNGAQMVHRLSAEAGDIFAAAAGWAGSLAEGTGDGNAGGGEQCEHDPYGPSPNPIPVWNGVGSRDDRFTGALPRLPLRPGAIERVSSLRQVFDDASLIYSVASTRTSEQPISRLVNVRPVGGYSPRWSPVMEYEALPGNNAGNEYLFVVLDRVAHRYPNAWSGQAGATRDSQGVTMAALQYEWFRDNPKPIGGP